MTPQTDSGPSATKEPIGQREVPSWPEFDSQGGGGYEVDHGELRAIATRLVVDLNELGVDIPGAFENPPFNAGNWAGAEQVSKVFRGFSDDLYCYSSDAMVECVVAACGIGTSGETYDITDNFEWLTRQSFWNRHLADTRTWSVGQQRSSWSSRADGYQVTASYPAAYLRVQSENLAMEHNYDGLSKEQVWDLLATGDENSMTEFSKKMNEIADDLDWLAGRLGSTAKQTHEVWRGSAAEAARGALKKIYDGILPLAGTYSSLGSLAQVAAEEIGTAKKQFEHVVADENWFTDMFEDDDDASAREYLKSIDRRLNANVLTPFPKDVRIELPGLIGPADRIPYHV
ncbi:hypothetical protein GCM10010191_58330 [Actinomadura vinacea]|uniref:Outer membrane channel protein CpnT-like N-terminal domain-containing protein n=1 Tax=Actinomadura vinacea TaxID=115336 RepID=A0ABN3JRN9_9ACTN